MKRMIAILIMILFAAPAWAGWQETLVDYVANPVFDPLDAGDRAYYPTVVYDADGFGTGGAGPFYRMWYSDGHDVIATALSNDGIEWWDALDCAGLTNPHHAKVVYDANGFGNGAAGPFYKIWYWDTANLYSINAIRVAESDDGIAWTNDQPLTQDALNPIITGGGGDWNRGSYGPIHIIYNSAATNAGANPFDYSYAMYYDGTTGGFEQIGLGYSVDGVDWAIADPDPVLPSGADWTGAWGLPNPWDSSYATMGTVIKDADGTWHFWYSGGTTASNQGIGYATSADGINWVKDAGNPLTEAVAGTWKNSRTYTPTVVYDENRFSGHGDNSRFKMWHTGCDPAGNYTIGYYGRSVAKLTVELGEKSNVSQDVLGISGEQVVSQWKLSASGAETINLTSISLEMLGALLDVGAIDKISVYRDLAGDGKIDSGTDILLGEAAPAATVNIAINATIAASEIHYWIVAVTLNDAASAGDDLHISLAANSSLTAIGTETNEIEKTFDVPINGSLLVVESMGSDENPAAQGGGGDGDAASWDASILGGGFGCALNAGAGSSDSAWLFILVLVAFVAFVRLRRFQNL